MDLPVKNWYQLLSYHSLNSSLSPLAAEQIFLDHIFHAQCFDSVPTEQSHCNVIQSNFLNNPQEFVRHLLDSALHCNATLPQLVSFCQVLGYQDHEIVKITSTWGSVSK